MQDEKAQLRRVQRQARLAHYNALGARGRAEKARAALAHLTRLTDLSEPEWIAGFWPLAGEFDCRSLLLELREQGRKICLPVVVAPGQALIFRRFDAEEELVAGDFGVMIPPTDTEEVLPDLILAPLLAFDEKGFRLGYGGGFYDRTLQQLRRLGRKAPVIGLAFQMQSLAAVPHDDYDEPMDGIVTEEGAHWFAATGGQRQ